MTPEANQQGYQRRSLAHGRSSYARPHSSDTRRASAPPRGGGSSKHIRLTFASVSLFARTSTGLMVLPTTRNNFLGRRVFLFAALGALACSHKNGDGAAGGPTDDGAASGAPDASFGFSPVDALAGQGGAGGVPGVSGAYPCLDNPQGVCAGKLYKGQSLPTDLFVMFDQSGSMLKKDDGVTTRMDAVRNAVDQFMKAPESSGLGIGIGYFGSK